jgi:hypothetical protein
MSRPTAMVLRSTFAANQSPKRRPFSAVSAARPDFPSFPRVMRAVRIGAPRRAIPPAMEVKCSGSCDVPYSLWCSELRGSPSPGTRTWAAIAGCRAKQWRIGFGSSLIVRLEVRPTLLWPDLTVRVWKGRDDCRAVGLGAKRTSGPSR